jgi:pimeloyl-ACP methyl ester carboxylesterase
MDILRAALGDQKLNYVGKSYGTYLGTLYAQFFPDKVGRMVLDGAIDPNVPVAQQNLTQAIGFEGALYAFIDDCQALPACPLPKSDEAAKEEITNLYTSAAANPLPQKNSRDDRPVTESLMVLGTASALYDNITGWPTLRKAIEEAQKGYGDTFIKLADIYSERQSNGKYLNNQSDSGAVIDCLDWRNSRTDEQLQQDVLLYKEKAPVLGPYLAYAGLTCQFFPESKQDSVNRATNIVKEINTTPIMIIGTLRDPATPYEWAVGLSKIIRSSILITLDADGHTGQGRGSECVDKAFDSYLIKGKTPQGNIACTL